MVCRYILWIWCVKVLISVSTSCFLVRYRFKLILLQSVAYAVGMFCNCGSSFSPTDETLVLLKDDLKISR